MSIRTIKLTAKRQATFPSELCRDLDLHPGDRLILERRQIDGAPAWVLRHTSEDRASSWFGALRRFASGKSHAMEDIRQSVGRRMGEEKP